MNRRTVVLVMIIAGIVFNATHAKYGGGTGEPNDPYQIKDANHMQAIGANPDDWDKHFKLMADIDLGPFDGKDGREKFNVIGRPAVSFTGIFDGNGFEIVNFTYMESNRDYVGLFGFVQNGEIQNIGLIDPNVYVDVGECIGSLAGIIYGSILSSCYVKGGSVSGNLSVGGLVGSNSGIISFCYSTGDVSGANTIGGLVGYNNESPIRNCYSTGSVLGNNCVGGLVGENDWDETSPIRNCYSASSVTGTGLWVGGLVGAGNGVSVSFWDIETSEQSTSGGGTGKTTAEMQQHSTFTNWDFINVWNIGENQTYPYLRVHLPSDINKDGIVNFLDVAITANQWMEGVE
jgi:hypothetical protein